MNDTLTELGGRVVTLREAKFSMDTFGDRAFDGLTLGEDWNGWACPYFTFEQAQHVVEAHRNNGGRATYEEHSDSFVFSFRDAGPNEAESYPAVEIEGRKVYPIGASNWIWEEGAVEAYESTN